jgi:hypothetical protein
VHAHPAPLRVHESIACKLRGPSVFLS